jgi:murein DD-endopeptidase MepM/ murein hydrolase activator NlpD
MAVVLSLADGDGRSPLRRARVATIGVVLLASALVAAACTRGTPAPVELKGLGGGSAARAPASAQSDRPLASPARPLAGDGEVIVRAGDTVYAIARSAGLPVRSVIAANGLKPPFVVFPGQRLTLPAGRFHDVRRGETIYGISRRYGVEMTELVDLNGIAAPYTITPDQRLLLPDRAVAVSDAEASTGVFGAGPSRTPAPSALASSALPPRAGGGFDWPVRGRVISAYGPQDNGRYNDGINIAARAGDPVLAAESGVVAYAGSELRGLGNLLLIRHDGGWITAYAHNDVLLVDRGDVVRRGQAIGKVGRSGNATGPQVHFEIRRGAKAVNPLDHLPKLTSLGIGRTRVSRS